MDTRQLAAFCAVVERRSFSQAAERLGVTPGQVILRWQVQLGALPIPKSATPSRQRENLDVLGFELTDDEVMALVTDVGFEVLEHQTDIEAPYILDPDSMLQTLYKASAWVARKPAATAAMPTSTGTAGDNTNSSGLET